MPKYTRVTMKDVARKADVSTMAVSRVLGNKGGISQETRERILAVAREMNYRPNSIAQSLRNQSTRTIGVITSDSSELVFSKVLQGIQESAAEAGYGVIIASTGQNAAREAQAIETMVDRLIDGLLFAAPMRTRKEDMAIVERIGIPVVLLMRSGSLVNIDSVSTDNYIGGYELVNYLLGSRDDNILFLSLASGRSIGQERISGYQRAMLEHGHEWSNEKVLYCEPNIKDGYARMQQIIRNGFRHGTVCCACDLIAIGAISAVQDAGLRVPEDIRVAGFDDIELSDYLSVPLTTMRQPKYEIGFEGVKLLLERLENAEMRTKHIVMRSELVIRKSA